MLFEVTADDIKLLGDADLRQLVARLCEQDVRTHGHSPASVTAGGHQDAPDGGIDVRVCLPNGAVISGYVPAPASGFQVKAQKMPRQEIIDEMAPKGILRPSIAGLASAGGAYVIVSSGDSVSDTELTEREKAMREALDGQVPHGLLTVKFYDRQRLATWVNLHPGIVSWVRDKAGRPISGWHPFGDWSSSPATIDSPYLLDDGVRLVTPSERGTDGFNATDGLNSMRRILGQPRGIVRLVGLSGVGKTRLVQALFDARIGADSLPQAEAVYTDISEGPDPVPLELASQLSRLSQRAILIVDNCGPALHEKLAAKVAETNSPLSLITVEYDINDDEPENTNVFKLDVASVDLMEKILEGRFPKLAAPSRRVIAEFSGGNSRIALALAVTAKDGESLVNLKNRDLFERLFHQNKDKDNNLLNAAKVCALLYSFDGETLTGEKSELAVLASLAGITADQLFAHVAQLKRRQLVQKRGQWRAILPHAIAHGLAKLALEDIPFEKIETAIMHSGSERMVRSFSKRMGYLHDDESAKKLVTKWLADGGFLEGIGNYNDLGTACFTNIAPIDPEVTLAFIERAAARQPEFFGEENRNRSMVVRVLRSIAYDPPLFDRAIALLKKFAIDKSDERPDSARELFKSLFMLYLSGTLATPAQRAQVIGSLLTTDVEAENTLGFDALRTMLQCGHFSSHYSFDFGARSRDYGLIPRTSKSFKEWFGEALKIAETVGLRASPVSSEVRKIVASSFSEVCARAGMMSELIELADKFSQQRSWPEGWIGVRTTIARYKDKMPGDDRQELEALSKRLQTDNLEDMVRIYGLSRDWGPLDFLETEEEGGERDHVKAHNRIQEICFDLGQKLGQSEDKLVSMLPELFASDSHKLLAIGRGIASGTPSLSVCGKLLMDGLFAQPEGKRNTYVLGGFMDEAARRSRQDTDGLLDRLLTDTRFHPHFTWLQSQAGFDANACIRLARALNVATIPLASFEQIAYGGAQRQIDDQAIVELLRQIAAKEGGVRIATEIVATRVLMAQDAETTASETLKAFARELLKELRFDERQRPSSEYMLSNVIKIALTRPEDEEIARAMCARITEGVRTYKIHAWDISDVIQALAQTFPRAVLDLLVEQADDDETTARNVFRDVRENRPCLLESIPQETVLAWAAEGPPPRYASLAQAVKYADGNDDDKVKNWSVVAEKLIELAPDPAAVLDVFRDRFEPMSWSGSRADILVSRMPLLEKLRNHARPEVAAWAQEAVPNYASAIERERTWEAKESRGRDERFEQ